VEARGQKVGDAHDNDIDRSDRVGQMLSRCERGDVGRALIDEALAHCTFASFCRDGLPVFVRPLRPSDRELDPDFIASLAQSSRLGGAFAAPYLSAQCREQSTDDDGGMVLVATTRKDGAEYIVGVAGYVMTEQPRTAEVAVTVRGACQNRGIATLLLDSLLQYARRRRIGTLSVSVPPDNAPMLGLARRMGFSVRHEP
jgi:acetyltransferase